MFEMGEVLHVSDFKFDQGTWQSQIKRTYLKSNTYFWFFMQNSPSPYGYHYQPHSNFEPVYSFKHGFCTFKT